MGHEELGFFEWLRRPKKPKDTGLPAIPPEPGLPAIPPPPAGPPAKPSMFDIFGPPALPPEPPGPPVTEWFSPFGRPAEQPPPPPPPTPPAPVYYEEPPPPPPAPPPLPPPLPALVAPFPDYHKLAREMVADWAMSTIESMLERGAFDDEIIDKGPKAIPIGESEANEIMRQFSENVVELEDMGELEGEDLIEDARAVFTHALEEAASGFWVVWVTEASPEYDAFMDLVRKTISPKKYGILHELEDERIDVSERPIDPTEKRRLFERITRKMDALMGPELVEQNRLRKERLRPRLEAWIAKFRAGA